MRRRAFFSFPLTALAVIVGLYFLMTFAALVNNWTLNWASVRGEMWGGRYTLFVACSVIAGALRIANFHPRFATKYGAWLAATPWHAGINLPLGPVSLVLEDLLLIVPLTLLAVADADVPPWVPVTGYVFGYCLMAVASTRSNRTIWFALSLTFLASLPVLWIGHLVVLYSVILISCVIAHLALSQSLRKFPWDLGDSMRDLKRRPLLGLAWPLNRAGPALPTGPIRTVLGFASAGLLGWWVYVLLALLQKACGENMGDMLLSTLVTISMPYFGITFALLRVIAFCLQYWPPISLWGRLRTGRLIIPGYDYVYITPLLICAVSFGLPRILVMFLPLPVVGAVTISMAAAIYFNGGPTLRSWQLTGHHRIMPGARREPPEPKPRMARL